MTTRSEKLSRLTIGSPCHEPWDEMQGDERRRHCLSCDRPVHDFLRMTPREIAVLVEANGGHLCARITRDPRGRLVAAEPPVPPPASAPAFRRASPVAAAVVGGLLGFAAAASPASAPQAAAISSPEKPEAPSLPERGRPDHPTAGGSLAGRIVEEGSGLSLPGTTVMARNTFDGREHQAITDADGRYTFDGLPAGVYDVEGEIEGFTVEPQAAVLLHPGERREVGLQGKPVGGDVTAMGGAMMVTQEPLRREVLESELIVLATAGPSVAIEPGQDYGEVETEFLVGATFKGKAPGRSIRIVHGEARQDRERLAAGTRVLAFLKAREEGDGRVVYESADYTFGLKILTDRELEAYAERLTALSRLVGHHGHGEPHPADLLEWTVATVEEPLTRSEEIGELAEALRALDRFAQSHERTSEQAAEDLRAVAGRFEGAGGAFAEPPAPALLAAYLTDRQKARLIAAFRSAPRFTDAEIGLFVIVRPWMGDAALPALADKLETGPEAERPGRDGLRSLAYGIERDDLSALLDAADEEIRVYATTLGGVPEEEAGRLVDRKVEETDRELRQSFARALRAK